MNYYTADGYVDIRAILREGITAMFLVGGRGIGKTYGALKTVVEDDIPFILMRRTQAQADLINKPEFSPFKSLNRDMGVDIRTRAISKYNAAFYDGGEDGTERLIGYTAALSTISNIRGFDASDVRLLIYDEFIPERHERPLKNEGAALLNAYETINRNRELKGEPPLQLLCLANANDAANPIFLELGLVSKVSKMKSRGQRVSIDRDRGVGIFLLDDSPISAAKSGTALYRMTTGGDFRRMALENGFCDIDERRVRSRNLREYTPLVSIGELTVYQHKSSRAIYVSQHRQGSAPLYSRSEMDVAAFRTAYSWLWPAVLDGTVEFENYLCQRLLTDVFR